MEIQALKFVPGVEKAAARVLQLESEDNLKELKEEKLPFALVIRSTELELLRKWKVVKDLKTKVKAIELSRVMLKHAPQIPAIDASSYTSVKRLMQGLQPFLKSAEKDKNFYLIGVRSGIFDELWPSDKQDEKRDEANNFQTCDPYDNDTSMPAVVLRLIGRKELPPGLAETFVGRSASVELVRQLIVRAAMVDTPVLILGATGTGKELVAQAIRKNDEIRENQPFKSLNCAAITGTLFESELFGYRKEAFTGATRDREGLWEAAGHGTLFLDEVGEMALEHQAKVLRALGSKVIRRVGDVSDRNVHARVVAATNRDLSAMVRSGTFREDLYYRLREFLIRTPPLREHIQDVPLLAQYFWNKTGAGKEKHHPLPPEIIEELKLYSWPGNVRELRLILSNLHDYFIDVERLELRHLRAVFHLDGQTFGDDSRRLTPISREDADSAESLRHLQRVYDVIHSERNMLDPLVSEAASDSSGLQYLTASLQYRLDELDSLCLFPVRFGSEQTFQKVGGLRSKMLFFQGLLNKDPTAALSLWKKSASGAFDGALAAVRAELDRLMKHNYGR